MDVTHVSSFGKLQYLHVSIDTCSGIMFASPLTGEKASHVIQHCHEAWSAWGKPQLGLERSAAQTYIDRYFARYPGVAAYMEEAREMARQTGYVETAFGRRLWFPDIRSSNGNRRQGAERAAINAPMQGTAADLIKLAMIAVQNWLEKSALKSRLVLQVHDELVLEVPDAELMEIRTHIPRLMSQVATLKVPLIVEIGVGPNWEAAH